MSPELWVAAIGGVLFVLATIVLILRYRKGSLEQLSLHPGEILLLEENDLRVEHHQDGVVVYPRCCVRLTTQRILVASPHHLQSSHKLRFLICYEPHPPEETHVKLPNSSPPPAICPNLHTTREELLTALEDESTPLHLSLPGPPNAYLALSQFSRSTWQSLLLQRTEPASKSERQFAKDTA